jgi:hypothetical protein
LTISIFQSERPLSAQAMKALPQQSLSSSWDATPIVYPFSWSLALDPTTLWFFCSLPGGGHVKSAAARGDFVEGLWEYDVAELFVRDAHGSYQEFNLAPNGAWWSMTHSEYRVRRDESRPATCLSVTTNVLDGCWDVVAAFDRRSLQVPLEEGSLVHVTGIHYAAQPIYLSSRPPRDIAPDFHHPSCFSPVRVIPVDVAA